MRPAHGFAIQAIGRDGTTASELDRRLGISKQAAGKTVDRLTRLGYVERVDYAADARPKLIRHIDRGVDVLICSAAIFEELCRDGHHRRRGPGSASGSHPRSTSTLSCPRTEIRCFFLTRGVWRDWYLNGSKADGFSVAPLPVLSLRATPHPPATLAQGIRLTDALDQVPRREYAYLANFENTPFTSTYERLRGGPGVARQAAADRAQHRGRRPG